MTSINLPLPTAEPKIKPSSENNCPLQPEARLDVAPKVPTPEYDNAYSSTSVPQPPESETPASRSTTPPPTNTSSPSVTYTPEGSCISMSQGDYSIFNDETLLKDLKSSAANRAPEGWNDFIYESGYNISSNVDFEELEKYYETQLSERFEEVILDPSTNEEVIKIEQELSNMGVKVTFADNLEAAKGVLETLKSLKEKGIELPKEIILMNPKNDSLNGLTVGAYEWNYNIPVIFIKEDLFSKDNYADESMAESELEYFENSTPEGLLTHEVGHYHHYFQRPDDTLAGIYFGSMPGETTAKVIQEVSAYALGDPIGGEFVAEVFTGLLDGDEYSDEIMEIYENLNGPSIN